MPHPIEQRTRLIKSVAGLSLVGYAALSKTKYKYACLTLGSLFLADALFKRRGKIQSFLKGRIEVVQAITIAAPPDVVSQFWNTLTTLENNHLDASSNVRLVGAPSGRGTEVYVHVHYHVRGGTLGAALLALWGTDLGAIVARELRYLKQLIEAGEVCTTEGQPSGRKALKSPPFITMKHLANTVHLLRYRTMIQNEATP